MRRTMNVNGTKYHVEVTPADSSRRVSQNLFGRMYERIHNFIGTGGKDGHGNGTFCLTENAGYSWSITTCSDDVLTRAAEKIVIDAMEELKDEYQMDDDGMISRVKAVA